MHTIYGYLGWQDNPACTQAVVARMIARLAACPWDNGGVCALPVQDGGGALAVQQAGEAGRSLSRPLSRNGLTIAADVRLDNRPALLAALQLDPAQGAALADPDLLLAAYRRWDVELPEHLLGDFAFAIWDEGRQRLFCARDFVGVRPFYYHHRPGQGFAWASDLAALLSHPDTPHRLDLAVVKAELVRLLGQPQHPAHTFYSAVAKLPPAHCLTVDRAGLRTWAYWQPGRTPERRYTDEGDYAAELRELLHAAVACRVQDTVQGVGAHLSGGLDSSSLAVIAQRILQEAGRSVTGFSWSPPYAVLPSAEVTLPPDERILVDAVAAAAGLPVHYTTLTAAHNLADAGRDITVQPTATLENELAVSQDAHAQGIRTLLSGWGGDELVAFNGRGYFADLLRRGRWLTLQRELTQRRALHGGAVWKQWITDGVFPLLPTWLLSWLSQEEFVQRPSLPPALKPDFAAALAAVELPPRPATRVQPGVRNMQIFLLNLGHIPYRLESWASHGATLGITYAYPLLDRRIVEFALSIPDEMFFKHGWKRYLFRAAMDGILPDAVRWNKKKHDPALFQHHHRVRTATQPARHAQLRARTANPFVDVEKLIAAAEATDHTRRTTPMTRQERRRLLRTPLGGHWLAFVDPAATY